MTYNQMLFLEALRSNVYSQAFGTMKVGKTGEGNRYAFCPLGVLCDISGQGEWSETYDGCTYPFVLHGTLNPCLEENNIYFSRPPKEVWEWLGVDGSKIEGWIIEMNDTEKLSFEEIANLLERYFTSPNETSVSVEDASLFYVLTAAQDQASQRKSDDKEFMYIETADLLSLNLGIYVENDFESVIPEELHEWKISKRFPPVHPSICFKLEKDETVQLGTQSTMVRYEFIKNPDMTKKVRICGDILEKFFGEPPQNLYIYTA
jgi:hypothetical protein